MSRLRLAFGLGTLVATAAAGLGASPSSASFLPRGWEVTTQVAYTCQAPLADPASPVNSPYVFWSYTDYSANSPFSRDATFTQPLAGLQRALDQAGITDATVSGTWRWHVARTSTSGTNSEYTEDVPVTASPIREGGGEVRESVQGTVRPPSRLLGDGNTVMSIDGLSFVIRGTNAAGQPADLGFVEDGDGDPLAMTITCAGPRTALGRSNGATAPLPPPIIGPITVTATSATVSISSVGERLEIYLGSTLVKSIPGRTSELITLDNLTPNRTYQLSALTTQTYGAPGQQSASFTTLPASTAIAVGGPAFLTLRSSRLTGSATGTTSISGDVNATTGAFSGAVALAPATASLKAYGWIPVKARLVFTPAGDATGTVTGDALALTTTQDVAIKNTTFLGLKVASGTCHTEVAPTITLRAPAAALTDGGTAAAAFALGRIVGCSTYGSLTGTNGGSISLRTTLAPTPAPTPTPAG